MCIEIDCGVVQPYTYWRNCASTDISSRAEKTSPIHHRIENAWLEPQTDGKNRTDPHGIHTIKWWLIFRMLTRKRKKKWKSIDTTLFHIIDDSRDLMLSKVFDTVRFESFPCLQVNVSTNVLTNIGKDHFLFQYHTFELLFSSNWFIPLSINSVWNYVWLKFWCTIRKNALKISQKCNNNNFLLAAQQYRCCVFLLVETPNKFNRKKTSGKQSITMNCLKFRTKTIKFHWYSSIKKCFI